MSEILIICAAGFATGVTTIVFGFGGGFVVVPFVYHFVTATGVGGEGSMLVAVATSTAVMILNAGYATWINQRRGNLRLEAIRPLFILIGLGAILGASIASMLNDQTIRLLFIAYMLGTIIDGLLRKGFLNKPESRPFAPATRWVGAPLIGAVATLLGVGGSVMTVPLLRRHGYQMKHCVSAANPLSLPVAILGTLMYAWLGRDKQFGMEYLGYINLKVLGVLVVSGISGILCAKRFMPSVSDHLHARAYLLLLLLVLVSSLWP